MSALAGMALLGSWPGPPPLTLVASRPALDGLPWYSTSFYRYSFCALLLHYDYYYYPIIITIIIIIIITLEYISLE